MNLNTDQIIRALQEINQFGGVIPSNKLPQNVRNKFYVINTDPSYMPGKHWVAVYTAKVPEFYDSLGRPPSFYNKDFEYFLINHGPNYIYNSQRIQSYGSSVCGVYCIYYVLKRSMGYSIKEIVQEFSTDLENNDRKIEKFKLGV